MIREIICVRIFGMDNDELYERVTWTFHGRGFNFVKPMKKLIDEEIGNLIRYCGEDADE